MQKIKMKVIVLFIFAIFLADSASYAGKFIVGGQQVEKNDPIQASTVGIYDPSPDGKSGSLCSGTLIGKDVALTAAHCVAPNGPKPVVIFGRDLRGPDAVHRQVSAVAVDPKYQSQAGKGMDQGDIALVKFNGGLPDGYQTVPTLNSEKSIKNGEKVQLAGYGINNAITKTGAGKLRKTQVSVLNSRPGKSEMILAARHL
jgi:hypothetical protein